MDPAPLSLVKNPSHQLYHRAFLLSSHRMLLERPLLGNPGAS
ncbi:hypothetical protein NC653_003271 [Populus alba x Populus x berolinensis]|uniref:Uncharacterized protein n=1 Tax=Populus alba x Populus x berolinensis TaxID=444605 RepID=A0AAD6RRB7_9ROSI|nr:hypothetical protein NC653_003271 [Populus alba x Populus x berolinensis]